MRTTLNLDDHLLISAKHRAVDERVIRTLRAWNIRIDEALFDEALFLTEENGSEPLIYQHDTLAPPSSNEGGDHANHIESRRPFAHFRQASGCR